VNGDGYDDVVVTAPGQTTQRTVNVVNEAGQVVQETVTLTGQVLLYLGSAAGLSSTPFWTFEGFGEGDSIRLITSSAGDVNNDGYDDLLIGVPYADVDRIETAGLVHLVDAGLAQLFLGSSTGPSAEPSWTYRGQNQGGLFGWAVGTAGDVNGDAFDDVLIGAYLEDSDARTDNGRAYLFLGRETGLSSAPETVLEGNEDRAWFGSSIAAAGDVNKDGFEDVVIGAPGRAGETGGVYLYLGSIDGLGENPLFIGAQTGQTWFGWEVAGAGDVNDDGFSDILVRTLVQSGDDKEGRVLLFLGASQGLANVVVEFGDGKEVGTEFGDPAGSIAGLGDVNGDGYDDVAIGAWLRTDEQGAVFVYQGAKRAMQALTIAAADFSHVFVEDGTYLVTVTVTGAANSADLGLLRVTVNNADPVVSVTVDPAEINENGIVTVRGTFTDAGILDTHTAKIDWGDGIVTPAILDQAAGKFTASHQYLDDDPTGTTSDIYTITASVTDDDGGVGAATTELTVKNVAPVLGSLKATTIEENGVTTLTGTITDPGTLDSFKLDVNWSDPLSPKNTETYTFAAGTKTFELTHQYLDDNPTKTASDQYRISLTITDDDTGTDVDEVAVTVNNVAPLLGSLKATTIEENGITTLTGTITDPGTLDSFELVVNWGDPLSPKNTETYRFAAGTKSFELTHQYLDDDPTGTHFDLSTIRATVADDDLGTDEAEIKVTVNNVAPVLEDLHTTTIQENGTTTLKGTITDPGTLDSFTLVVNWGDPLSAKNVERYTFGALTKDFELTHQYLDDNPTGTASDQYTISLRITDDDAGTGSGSTTVTVNNVAPKLENLKTVAIEENGTTTLTGTITDPGTLDTFELVVNWGDPLSLNNSETYSFAAGTKAFKLTHQYLDDNPSGTTSDQYTISLKITDDDTGTSSGSTTVRVNNVAPVITCLTTSAKEVGDAKEGEKISISAIFKDVGRLDTHTAVIDWGDGTASTGQVTKSCDGGSISGSHVYKWGGVYEIKVTLNDDDTGTASKSVTGYITGAGVKDGVLQIVGTKCDDNVTVNQEKKGIKVHADFLPERSHFRTFDLKGIERIEIYLGKGDDHAQIAGNMDLPVFMDGGSGDDHLNAGRGPAVLIGGSGDDKLIGSPSDDRIYGGDGNDFIQGNGGNDVLYGDAGCDVIYGSKGNDQIHGGEGNDWISGGGGNDVLNGDAGCDVIYGSCGNDQIYGGEGGDWIFGEGGNDKLYGGSGNDRLFGGCGNDLILGEEGDDLLVGGGGSDTIDGGPGNDLIYGCDKKGPFWLHMPCGGKGFIDAFDSWISDFIDDIAKGHDHKPDYCFNTDQPQNNQNKGNSGNGFVFGRKR
jgi:hypothetical protein